VEFVLREIYENKQLLNAKDSAKRYWLSILRNDDERQKMKDLVRKHDKRYIDEEEELKKVEKETITNKIENSSEGENKTENGNKTNKRRKIAKEESNESHVSISKRRKT